MTRATPQGERSQRWRLDAAGNRLPLPSTLMQTSAKSDQPDWSAQVRQNLNNLDFNLLKPEQGGPGANAEVQLWKTNRVERSTQTDKNGQGRTVHYRYDAHGNRIQSAATDVAKMLMHYDALHQLIRVEQFNEDGKALSTTAYRYDAFGRRLSKTHRATVQETPQTQEPAQTQKTPQKVKKGSCLLLSYLG